MDSKNWLKNKKWLVLILVILLLILTIPIIAALPQTRSYLSDRYRQKGHQYLSSNNFGEAIKNFNYALKLNPKNYDASLLLGYAFFSLGDFVKAEAYYNETLALNSDPFSKALSYYQLSRIYSIKGDYPKTLEYLNQALEQKIADSSQKITIEAIAYPTIGIAYFYSGDKTKAAEFLNKGLEIVENQQSEIMKNEEIAAKGYTYIGLGNYYYFFTDDYSKAIQYFNKTLEIADNSFNSAAYYGLGKVYFLLGEYDNAIKNLNTALEMVSAKNVFLKVEIYDELGKSYLQLGDCNKTTEYFDRVLKEKDDIKFNAKYISTFETAAARLALGECNLKTGNDDEALKQFNDGLDYFSGSSPEFFYEKLLFNFFSLTLNYKIAAIYNEKGDVEQAKIAINKASVVVQSLSADESSIIERAQWPKDEISIFNKIKELKKSIGK